MRRIYNALSIVGIFIVLAAPVNAQINIDLNVGSQPVWGPVGYDYVENYYVPDLDLYYNVPQNRYYYYEKDRWVYNTNLPSRYSRFNLYNHYKVIVNEPEPWRKHKYYKDKYYSYRGRHDQQLIHDSRDFKYFVIKNHPNHNKWIEKQKYEKSRNKNKSDDNNKNDNNKRSDQERKDNKNAHGKHKK